MQKISELTKGYYGNINLLSQSSSVDNYDHPHYLDRYMIYQSCPYRIGKKMVLDTDNHVFCQTEKSNFDFLGFYSYVHNLHCINTYPMHIACRRKLGPQTRIERILVDKSTSLKNHHVLYRADMLRMPDNFVQVLKSQQVQLSRGIGDDMFPGIENSQPHIADISLNPENHCNRYSSNPRNCNTGWNHHQIGYDSHNRPPIKCNYH